MSRSHLPSVETQTPADDPLVDYFQSVLPTQWPEFRPPDAVPSEDRRWKRPGPTLMRSRLAVAASVALLAVASLWVAGGYESRERPGTRANPSTWEARRQTIPGKFPAPPRTTLPSTPGRRLR